MTDPDPWPNSMTVERLEAALAESAEGRHAARADADRLAEALREVEWIYADYTEAWCPECGWEERKGHRPQQGTTPPCDLGEALRLHDEAKG